MNLAEYHSGYMHYSRRALETIQFEALQGLRIAEVAIPTIYAGEKSHLNPVRYGFDVLSVVRDYRRGKYRAM